MQTELDRKNALNRLSIDIVGANAWRIRKITA